MTRRAGWRQETERGRHIRHTYATSEGGGREGTGRKKPAITRCQREIKGKEEVGSLMQRGRGNGNGGKEHVYILQEQ